MPFSNSIYHCTNTVRKVTCEARDQEGCSVTPLDNISAITIDVKYLGCTHRIHPLIWLHPSYYAPDRTEMCDTAVYKSLYGVFKEYSADSPLFHLHTGPQLEQLMQQLRNDLATNPPIPGSFSAKKGISCIAKFTDGLW